MNMTNELPEEYQLIERYKLGKKMPVGSVIKIGNKQRFYRDIGDKNIMIKNGWKSLFIDCVVLNFLKDQQIEKIHYYNYNQNILYVSRVDDFNNIRVVEMANRDGTERLQKGLTLDRWEKRKRWYRAERPLAEVVIELGKKSMTKPVEILDAESRKARDFYYKYCV
jgi:hypothetical protein